MNQFDPRYMQLLVSKLENINQGNQTVVSAAKERSQQSAFFRWCQFCCHKAMLFKRSFSNTCVFALAMLQSWCELSRICPDGVQAGWNAGGTCQSH